MLKKFMWMLAAMVIAFSTQAQVSITENDEELLLLPLIECPPLSVYCFPSADDNIAENDITLNFFGSFPDSKTATKFEANRPFNKLRIWGLIIAGSIDVPEKTGHLPPQSIVVDIYDKSPDAPDAEILNFAFNEVIPHELLDLTTIFPEEVPDGIVYSICLLDVDFGQYIDLQNGWISFNFPLNDLHLLKMDEDFVNIFLPFMHLNENYANEADPETLIFFPEFLMASDIIQQSMDSDHSPIFQVLENFTKLRDPYAVAGLSDKNGSVWMPVGLKPFFALSSDTVNVPLSSWAFIIPGILILVFVAFRFTRW